MIYRVKISLHTMFNLSYCSLLFFILLTPGALFAQTNTSFPVATTQYVADANLEGGEVVTYDEGTEQYMLSSVVRDGRVYGVTAYRPPLVFATGSGTIPVVAAGITKIQVNTSNGTIQRGDLLVTSDMLGTAMRADIEDDAVFAIALEDFARKDGIGDAGVIVAEVGIEGARELQEKRRQIEKQTAQSGTSTEEQQHTSISFMRAAIASIIAIGGLFFILYSFRSTIAKGVVSIGRNPRARTSIMALAFGNIFFALILCAVAIFIAIGILVLPL